MPFLSVGDCLLLLEDLQAHACLLQPQAAHMHRSLPHSVTGPGWRSLR